MKSLSFKEPWVNSYVERLLGLSTATKKAIIRLLERSMQQEDAPGSKPKKPSSDDAFGTWVGPESAEEIIDTIYKARTQNPDSLPL
jgi:hypothetical protein